MARFANAKAPFIRLSDTNTNDTRRIMIDFFIALLPVVLFAWFKNGILVYIQGNATFLEMLYPLFFMAVGSFLSLLMESVFFLVTAEKADKTWAHIWKKTKTSYGIFPGLILTLLLPLYTPVWVLMFGVFMATIVGKMLFGGFGNNIFNPAIIGRMAIMFTLIGVVNAAGGMLNVSEALVDSYAGATPLTLFSGLKDISYDALVAPYGTLWDFFIGTIPGSLGETSAMVISVSYLWLVLRKVIKWYTPVIFIGTVFGLTWLIGIVNGETGIWFPLYGILSGGLFYGAVFMATEPVTTPRNKLGKIYNALFLGALTVLFRYIGDFPEGVATSIIVMNIFNMPLDKITSVIRSTGLNKKTWVKFALVTGLLLIIAAYAVFKSASMYTSSILLIGGLF